MCRTINQENKKGGGMVFFEEVEDLSKKASLWQKIVACLLFSNSFGAISHYRALEFIGFRDETLKKMDDYNVIWYWRRQLIDKGVLKQAEKQWGEFAVSVSILPA
jgi:hypothetical protein